MIRRLIERHIDAINNLANAVSCMAQQTETISVLQRIDQMENRIMSVISEYAAKQKAFNERHGAAIDAAVASVTGLTEDVKTLNDKITELQNSSGTVTPEDQALIDELVTQGEALVEKIESVATTLATLDQQTPPPVPVG